MGGENRLHRPILASAARFVIGRLGRSDELCADTFISGLGEVLRKPKRVRGCAKLLVALQPLAALGDGGDMAGWDPPKAVAGLIHVFEPFGTIAEYLRVIRFVGEAAQRLDRIPDRHINDYERIVVVPDVGGVARFRLEPPDKARSLVGKSIDGFELSDEFGDLRIIQRSEEARYVNLSEMMGHGQVRVVPSKGRIRN